MRLARWLLTAILMLPLMELAMFVAVAAAIGFGPAFGLILLGSIGGMLLLRHAGGSHVSRVRVAMADGNFSALQADGTGGVILLAGILLLIPGFITDVIGLVLLVAPLRRALFALAGLRQATAPPRADGVVDLEPEQWRRVPDPELPDSRNHRDGR
ncbi:MAG TPA: FxsA family protein [Pseudolabrys sp.]|nr:FxsA family protein [Pseudolabrys sp.]